MAEQHEDESVQPSEQCDLPIMEFKSLTFSLTNLNGIEEYVKPIVNAKENTVIHIESFQIQNSTFDKIQDQSH